jgi:glycosyltransferase involved in cell wall biosynthesis
MEDPQNLFSEQAEFFAPARSYRGHASPQRRVRDAAAAVYSVPARHAIARLLDRARPDVAHLHNIYHQLTFSIVDELNSRGIPMVQTLHDWKLACPAYTLFTEGAPCRRCVNSNVLHAIRHRCVTDSLPASAVAALEAAIAHRRGSYDLIDRYIAPSEFAKSIAQAAGIPAARVDLVPYLIPDAELGFRESDVVREPVFFCAGRLEETKGIRQLLAAFERVPPPARLQIAGWGSLQGEVEAAAARNSRIEFLGTRSREEVLNGLARSRALLLPSVWEDNCPLVLLEAQACSTPAIVSDRGGLPEFVRDGVHGFVIDPEDIASFSARIVRMADDHSLAADMGLRGRERLLMEHRADVHYERLLETYARVRSKTTDP